MYLFNVRVYGILVNQDNQVLISDERVNNVAFTKFPGGGLEYGEGLIDALKREFLEECGMEIEIVKHVYTTDFYEKSSFNNSQILSIYYQVRSASHIELDIKNIPFDFDNSSLEDKQEVFRLVNIRKLYEHELTFKTDKVAWRVFLENHNN